MPRGRKEGAKVGGGRATGLGFSGGRDGVVEGRGSGLGLGLGLGFSVGSDLSGLGSRVSRDEEGETTAMGGSFAGDGGLL